MKEGGIPKSSIGREYKGLRIVINQTRPEDLVELNLAPACAGLGSS
jgi:hypothetical protein